MIISVYDNTLLHSQPHPTRSAVAELVERNENEHDINFNLDDHHHHKNRTPRAALGHSNLIFNDRT